MYIARMGNTAPFIVIDTDILSRGMPSKRICSKCQIYVGVTGDRGLARVKAKNKAQCKRAGFARLYVKTYGVVIVTIHLAKLLDLPPITFISSTESIGTPAMPTSPCTRG